MVSMDRVKQLFTLLLNKYNNVKNKPVMLLPLFIVVFALSTFGSTQFGSKASVAPGSNPSQVASENNSPQTAEGAPVINGQAPDAAAGNTNPKSTSKKVDAAAPTTAPAVATINLSPSVINVYPGNTTVYLNASTVDGSAVHWYNDFSSNYYILWDSPNLNPTPTLSSSLTPTVCSGVSFNYNPTSATPGATFAWTRAAGAAFFCFSPGIWEWRLKAGKK